uniref:Phosphoribosyltransferase domain-containing protein n=1 Tax=Phytophthora ramorum TaxID=164328 RepID=H3H1H6_PHYRM
MAMEGEQAGLVGRFETEHAGYRERNYGPAFQPPATSFGFSLPKPLRPTTADTSPKSSRYLREIDRRTILARLDQGEKQSALAKEFRVTRAAICNLNKHRELVLSRQHEDPLAKHPKKARRRRDAGDEAEAALSRGDGSNRISQLLSDASPTHYEDSTLHLVALQPAERLIPLLLSSETSNAAFRRYCDRLMTLVVEEVLAWTHTETSNTRHAPTPCGVSIAPGGSRMLSVFQALEPELPTGQIELRLPQFGSVVDLPAAVASHNVCLFYAFTDTAGGVRVAKGIRELLDRGAVEELLCLVTLAVSALTVGELQRAHPSLRIAAAHVESHEDDERLHHTENEPYEASRPTSRLQLLATRAAEMY